MNILDWYELPEENKHKLFNVNGVPYPHDEWLALQNKLQNKMTTDQAAELVRKWRYVK